jgi:hypothetical protein
MNSDKVPVSKGVPIHIPPDIWKPLMEIRLQLDSISPGTPTPIEETLREIINHYEHCPRTQQEIDAFRERSKAWKRSA